MTSRKTQFLRLGSLLTTVIGLLVWIAFPHRQRGRAPQAAEAPVPPEPAAERPAALSNEAPAAADAPAATEEPLWLLLSGLLGLGGALTLAALLLNSATLPLEVVLLLYLAVLIQWIGALGLISLRSWRLSAAAFNAVRVGLAAAGILCAGFTYVLAGNDRFTAPLLVVWMLSIVLWALALRQPRAVVRPMRLFRIPASIQITLTGHRLALIALLAIGAAALLYQLDTIPYDMHDDQGEYALNVADIERGDRFIYFAENNGRESIHMYVAAAFMPLAGSYFLAIKLSSALAAFLTLPALYFFGRAVEGRRTGLLTLAFGVTCLWLLIMGRIGWRVTYGALAVAWLLVTLAFALRTGKRTAFLLAGLVLGVGMYGYSSFRLAPLLVITVLGWSWLRASAQVRRALLINAAALAIMAVLTVMPMLRYWQNNPEIFWWRMGNTVGTSLIPPLDRVADGFMQTARMFNEGLEPTLFNIAYIGAPVLTPIVGALFVVGTVLWIVRAVRRRDALTVLIPLALIIGLLPSALAVTLEVEMPSSRRAIMALPVVLLLAGSALAWLIDVAVRLLQRLALPANFSRWAASAAAVMLLGVSAAVDLHTYFNDYAHNYRTSPSRPLAEAIARAGVPLERVYLVYGIGWAHPGWLALWLNQPDWDNTIVSVDPERCLPKARREHALVILSGSDLDNVAILQACYPTGEVELVVNERGDSLHVFHAYPT